MGTPVRADQGALATVVAKLPVPLPVTSPVKVIVWSPVFVPEDEPEKFPAAMLPITSSDTSVPTEVRLDAVTFGASVVPVRVSAAAVTVTLEDPSNATPLISAPGSSFEAVAAFPVVFWLSVGKSAATAIERSPVLVVLLRIPVVSAAVPAL